ncbi:MAG: putative signal transducing protein [Flavobacteriaceae bacterium]
MELVTVRTFDNSIQAHLLKSKLESEGITCYLFDENIVGLNPLYNITVGGIKLKINKFDMDKASLIIQELDQSELTNDQGESLKCPNCHSEEIYSGFKSMKGIKGILSVIISFLLVVFPIYLKTVKKCKECGYEFK